MANHGIINYPDAQLVTKQLDALIKKPIYSIKPEALENYCSEYFEKKCPTSKKMIEEAKQVIPRRRSAQPRFQLSVPPRLYQG